MRECLYHPEFGYYSRNDAQRFADFYTSVDVHPIFGRLLARQLAEMWERSAGPRNFGWSRRPPAPAAWPRTFWISPRARACARFTSALRYVAVEQSAARRARTRRGVGCTSFRAGAPSPRAGASAANCRRVHLFQRIARCACPCTAWLSEDGALREVYVTLEARGTCVREELGSRSRRPRSTGTYFQRAGHHSSRRTAGRGRPGRLPLDRGCRARAWAADLSHRGLRPRGRGALQRAAHARHAAGVFAAPRDARIFCTPRASRI